MVSLTLDAGAVDGVIDSDLFIEVYRYCRRTRRYPLFASAEGCLL